MLDWFIPTTHNGYRARLLKAPFLILMTAVVLLVNASPLFPKAVVEADVEPNQLLVLHNQERSAAGLAPIRLNGVLSNSAQQKALAMLQTNCWSHYCPEGKSPWEFFSAAGYSYVYAGENLAEGFFDNDDVMNAWMNSPTHRENIMRPEYEEVGFGIVRGDFQGKPNNIVIAAHFGTPTYAGPSQPGSTFTPPAELPTPEITVPPNDSFTNAEDLSVSGNAPSVTAVNLFNSGELWTIADASQGIFTYRPPKLAEGVYTITAQGVAGVRQSSISVPVKFTIDRTPDTLSVNNFLLVSFDRDSQLVTVNITKPGLKAVQMTVSGNQIDFRAESPNLWSAECNSLILGKAVNLELFVTDLAGNTWTGSVPAGPIQDSMDSLPNRNLAQATQIAGITITQATITWAVVGFLICLFALDFITLRSTGLTNVHIVRRSQWHLAVLMLLVVVAVSGSLHGQVGQGVSVLGETATDT